MNIPLYMATSKATNDEIETIPGEGILTIQAESQQPAASAWIHVLICLVCFMEFWVKLVLCHFQPNHFPFLVTYWQWGRPGFDLWVGKIPWRRGWLPIPVFLPGELPWTEEPGRLRSMGSQRVRHDWATKPSTWEMSFPGGSDSKSLPAMLETRVQSLGWEDPPKKGMEPTPVFLPGEFHAEETWDYHLWGTKSRTRLSD